MDFDNSRISNGRFYSSMVSYCLYILTLVSDVSLSLRSVTFFWSGELAAGDHVRSVRCSQRTSQTRAFLFLLKTHSGSDEVPARTQRSVHTKRVATHLSKMLGLLRLLEVRFHLKKIFDHEKPNKQCRGKLKGCIPQTKEESTGESVRYSQYPSIRSISLFLISGWQNTRTSQQAYRGTVVVRML